MTGPIGLHGGGEYLAGDEPFLDALLAAACQAAEIRAAHGRAAAVAAGGLDDRVLSERGADAGGVHGVPIVRVVVVPTAASRGRPDLAAQTGRAAFLRRAKVTQPGVDVRIEIARIVDAWSADDPAEAERLFATDLIHFPGGDPDLIPSILAGTRTLGAIEASWRAGAVLAGASAGAMAIADWTWTPHGGLRGLGFVRGIAVVPHYDDVRLTRWQDGLDAVAPPGLGYLGLDERTGVIGTDDGLGGRTWTVIGPGAAHWFPAGAVEASIGHDGDRLDLLA